MASAFIVVELREDTTEKLQTVLDAFVDALNDREDYQWFAWLDDKQEAAIRAALPEFFKEPDDEPADAIAASKPGAAA